MRTQADRDELRARRGTPVVTTFSGEAAALRVLGHTGAPMTDARGVCYWAFPPSAGADAERYRREARRAAAERHAKRSEQSVTDPE
jgi:hypothetical protein